MLKFIKLYFEILISNLVLIHIGKFKLQAKACVIAGTMVSPFMALWERVQHWSYTNQEYILFVLYAVALDHLLGSIKHWRIDRDFTWTKNATGLGLKLGLVVGVGLLFEGLTVIVKSDNFIYEYLATVSRLIVFLYPAGSAFGNSSVLSGGRFPPKAWIDKIAKFQNNVDINEFKNKTNDNESPES